MKAEPSEEDLRALAVAFRAQLGEAERYLDTIVGEACAEARANAPNPRPLIALVERTRQLSSR